MKLTTYYIEEVLSVKPHSANWTTGFPSKVFFKVSLVVRNGKHTQQLHRIWNALEWEQVKERGLWVE